MNVVEKMNYRHLKEEGSKSNHLHVTLFCPKIERTRFSVKITHLETNHTF